MAYKYKVGDEVRLKEDYGYGWNDKDICIVIKIRNNEVKLRNKRNGEGWIHQRYVKTASTQLQNIAKRLKNVTNS